MKKPTKDPKPTAEPINPKEFLYTPAPGGLDNYPDKVRAWHKRMAAVYTALVDKYPHWVMYRWLRKAGVKKDQMQRYGVEISVLDGRPTNLTGEWIAGAFDHCRVLKRRSDGAMFILGEPYDSLERVEKNAYLNAWRSSVHP
jgi:hypothetical protein